MNDYIGTPFFYIVLICVLVFLYVIATGILKYFKAKKKVKSNKAKADEATQTKTDEVEKVQTYEEFAQADEEIPVVKDESLEKFTTESEVKSFEEQAFDFLNDSNNNSLLEDFFGVGAGDLFSKPIESQFDYAIKEYDYNKIWEYEPAPIDYNYNYDVNYEPPKRTSKLRKQFKKMNKIQKALVVASIFDKNLKKAKYN